MTNIDFARRVGCSRSMASRLRDGKRLPSVRLMKRIAAEFDVSIDDLVRVHTQGSEAFGELLRDRVFGDTQPVA